MMDMMSMAKGSGPYGGGKCKGKGKGKPKGKGFAPKTEKPMVNPNQINPGKEPFDGGISFKNIFQEKLSKQIRRPIQPGDLVYTCIRVKGGKTCSLTTPCMPETPPFETDMPGKDDKVAGQMAAAKALEALFPEVYQAVLEAHAAGSGAAGAPSADGAAAALDPMGEPKGLLNQFVQLTTGRPVAVGDVVYETQWRSDLRGYVSVVKLNALDGGAGTHAYASDLLNCTDAKQAEKSAARKALEVHAAEFEAAKAVHEQKKVLESMKSSKGAGKSFGKGFGKSFGKGFGGKKGGPY